MCENLINKIFGNLTVITLQGKTKNGNCLWNCVCTCGNTCLANARQLKRGKLKSCGCLKRGSKRKERIGEIHNRLTITSFSHSSKNRLSYYNCLCECGKSKIVSLSSLLTGKVKSCGCFKKKVDNNRRKENNPNWNPEITDEDRARGRNIEGYKEWSFEVKKRDNFTCQICKDKTSGNLVSHHLNNYKDFPLERTEVSNGICLCRNCHKSFHLQFGFFHTNKEMFMEYKIKCQVI